MATDVNPPPIPRMPKEWFSKADVRVYQESINRIIYQLWINSPSGGTQSNGLSLASIVSLIKSQLFGGLDGYYAHAVSANYTTIGYEIIDASNTITITLNGSPSDGETVKVSHQGDYGDVLSITDGTGTDILHVPGDSVIYSYNADLGRWI